MTFFAGAFLALVHWYPPALGTDANLRYSATTDRGAAMRQSAVPTKTMPILNPRSYLCRKTGVAPSLDGRLDDGAWRAAPWSEDFRDILGDAKPRPRFRTRVKMLWDASHLYIGAELEEPYVWATIKQPDAIVFYDNDFEVFIDPDGDNHLYYEIEINAFGTVWDQVLTKPYRDGGVPITHWDLKGLKVATHVDGPLNDPSRKGRGWTVEIAIPWSGIMEDQQAPNGTPYPKRHYAPKNGESWRMNFSRVEWQIDILDGRIVKRPETPEDNWTWCEQGAVDMHRPEHWGYVQFTDQPAPEPKITPDSSLPARNALIAVYYAQKEYMKRNGSWARSLRQLGDVQWESPGVKSPPVVEATSSLFEARATVRYPDGSDHTWAIGSDSRIWEVAEGR